MKKVVAPKGMPKPIGYSPAVRAGNMLFISGQIAEDANGNIVGKGDFEAQVRQVFENIKALLEAEGGSFDNLVKIKIHLTDMRNVAKFREIRKDYLKGDFPASTLIGVTGLIMPELMIEIDAIAVL